MRDEIHPAIIKLSMRWHPAAFGMEDGKAWLDLLEYALRIARWDTERAHELMTFTSERRAITSSPPGLTPDTPDTQPPDTQPPDAQPPDAQPPDPAPTPTLTR